MPPQGPHSAAAERPRRSAPADTLLVVGLVGRAGSGKSTVARALAAVGAQVLDADRMGHEVTDGDAQVRTALIEEYGAGVYRDDGTLVRSTVAARVFSDAAALERLNLLVHPRILVRLRSALASLAKKGHRGAVVVDAALLLDWGFERECDRVLAVCAPESQQIARLVARGLDEADARARLARQRSDAAFSAAADAVLVNDRDPADLGRRAVGIVTDWLRERSLA